MGILTFDKVCKGYGEGPARAQVLRDINLDVAEGEFVAILGFSGSGKTTLINLIAGLTLPDSGAVTFRGKPMTGPGPERGVVFQSYSLMPWLTVRGNVLLAVDAMFPKLGKAPRWPRPITTSTWSGCPMPPIAGRRNCRAGCASGSPWPARWRWTPICCCWTNRCRRWMR